MQIINTWTDTSKLLLIQISDEERTISEETKTQIYFKPSEKL